LPLALISPLQKPDEAAFNLIRMLEAALPHSNYVPAVFPQEAIYSPVSSFVTGYLLPPKFLVGFRCSSILTIIMAVPETTVDTNMIVRAEAITKSGLPGIDLTLRRHATLDLRKIFATCSSGPVRWLFTEAII